MREIKFRGWCETDDGDEMVYFGRLDCDNGLWFNSDKHINEHYSIMQFTGLVDKNCKDIYEGDIITYEGITSGGNIIIRKIEYSQNRCGFMEGMYNLTNDGMPKPTIIGNIHENPELI